MPTKRRFIPLTALILTALVACNLPQAASEGPSGPNAAFTAAAMTVAAQLTGLAQAPAVSTPTPTATGPAAAAATVTPTPPPTTAAPPTITPTSTQSCDQAQFVADVTVPDGTHVDGGATFTKTWRLKNVGTCAWTTAYTLFFASGNPMGGPSTVGLLGTVNPGETVDVSVNLTAPSASGDYSGFWKLRNAAGLAFTSVYAKITVGDSGPFAVIHVEFNVTGSCGAWHVNATVQTNGPGTVTYHWIYETGTDTLTHDPLVYSAAGTQTIGFDDSAASTTWVDLYIDSPNHYEFKRANLTCP